MSRFDHAESPHAVALGWVPGATSIDAFGFNADVDAASAPEDIWFAGGIYTGFPGGAAETLHVLSTSTADTAVGTGMRTLRLIGLDGSGNPQTEDVTLNGTTPVTTTKSWSRMYRAYGLTSGSGTTNAGPIIIRHSSTSANVFANMPPFYSQTAIVAYTVPAGRFGLLVNAAISVSNAAETAAAVTFALVTREYGSALWRVRRILTASTSYPAHDTPAGGVLLNPRTDMVIRAISATADSQTVTARFDLLVHRVPSWAVSQHV